MFATSTVVGICIGTVTFIAALAVVGYYCYYKRRYPKQDPEKGRTRPHGIDQTLPLKRPTAVKSPGSGPLKKSPSPTSLKSPPGQSAKLGPSMPDLRSSTDTEKNAQNQVKRISTGTCTDQKNSPGSSGSAINTTNGFYRYFVDNDKDNVNEKANLIVEKKEVEIIDVGHVLIQEIYNPQMHAIKLKLCDNMLYVIVVIYLCEDEEDFVFISQTYNELFSCVWFCKGHIATGALKHDPEKNSLVVTIEKCSDLPSTMKTDSNMSATCDPYVKLQLLPDKQHKVKTRVVRKTTNPVYDEDFTFYGISNKQLSNITLHFVILSCDRYSRDDIIGEVVCNLNVVDLINCEKRLSLTKEIVPRHLQLIEVNKSSQVLPFNIHKKGRCSPYEIQSDDRGELLISLCYQPVSNRLTVVVLKANKLPKIDITGLLDPYVKVYLLYNGQRIAKKKTHVKKRTLNPVFNESFVFEVPNHEGLENLSLEFLLLDWDRMTKNEVIGRVELGNHSRKVSQKAINHWMTVCNSPRRQIAEWHVLKG
ncbi:Synaptotagmin-11 [Nymphon striatum]|nr:Synaptotagmin-11 [Nymphon striatum]